MFIFYFSQLFNRFFVAKVKMSIRAYSLKFSIIHNHFNKQHITYKICI